MGITHAAAWDFLRNAKSTDFVRPCVVHEKDGDGKVQERLLDVRDVEERRPEPKEIILVDQETERQILSTLKVYRGTLLYVSVMVTVGVLILILQIIF